MSNLSLPQPYEGPYDIHIGDGSGLKITHTGFVSFSPSFTLSNVLCVPSIKQNLISVSQFCRNNHTSIEFFPSYFVVKDLHTGISMLRGRNQHDLYEWPTAAKVLPNHAMALPTCISKSTSPMIWHRRRGHPSIKTLQSLGTSSLVSFSSSLSSYFFCESYLCNKSQRLPFGDSTLQSSGPLDLVYTDVWGPSSIKSIDCFFYYVIFVDHFIKHIWLYPLRLKSDVYTIFLKFKAVVEKIFKRSIIIVYSDIGGEYTSLREFLSTNGIQHLKTPPTPFNIMALLNDVTNILLTLV